MTNIEEMADSGLDEVVNEIMWSVTMFDRFGSG